MKVKELTAFLESIAPLSLQESYDNSGLIVGDPEMEIGKILVCLDSTPEVIQEAIDGDYNMVIAHHPIVFSGLKSLTGKTYVERAIITAIRHDVAIYAIHTNLDNVLSKGVNGQIAKKLGLRNVTTLLPGEIDDTGAGAIGAFERPMPVMAAFEHIKQHLAAPVIRHTKLIKSDVQLVALCGGSGSFLLHQAIDRGADLFLTADFKYHQFFDAEDKIIIADIGHYESEQFTIDLLMELIQDNFPKFAPDSAKTVTNPINYYY